MRYIVHLRTLEIRTVEAADVDQAQRMARAGLGRQITETTTATACYREPACYQERTDRTTTQN